MRFLLTCLLALSLLPSAGAAHEFTIALLVGPEARQQARDAFLLAAGERDGHPGETSEGHLGGVDAQLQIVTPGQQAPASDIIVAIAPRKVPADADAPWVFAATDVTAPARAAFLGSGAQGFEARFRALYGYAPGPAARQTYIAARLVDIAVRALDGVGERDTRASAIAGLTTTR